MAQKKKDARRNFSSKKFGCQIRDMGASPLSRHPSDDTVKTIINFYFDFSIELISKAITLKL